MTDPVHTFERRVLRPSQLILLTLVLVAGIQAHWWWVGGSIFALLYLGTVGASLHPRQSAADLTRGPIESVAARAESASLSYEQKAALVGRACTRVAIPIAIYALAIANSALELPWYWSVGIAWVVLIAAGAALKLAFRVV